MSQSEYQRLRSLLLHEEQQRLQRLEELAVTPAERVAELDQVLPVALQRAAGDERLAQALAQPIKHGLGQAIREDAPGLAEVLFPVMGPSIRRAIAESLRDFVAGFNASVAQAVSWQGLRWRVEALRSGRSYGEVVLSQTLSYQVQQALLIHRDSGLVISRAELSEVVANDSDAFSAMLSAIQDFVSDSLQGDSTLSTLDMGERTIWIVQGPHAVLACIISGLPQPGLREFLADLVDETHNAYGGLLRDYSGDRTLVAGIDGYTERALGTPLGAAAATAPRWPMLILLLLLLAGLAWWLLGSGKSQAQRIQQAMQDQPGLLLQNLQREGDGWQLSLLRDPLAADPQQLLAAAGLADAPITIHSHAYQSLDQALLLKRLRQSLRMPDGLQAELNAGVLTLSGRAPWAYLRRLNQAHWLPPGIHAIDSRAVEVEYGLDALRRALPAGVSVAIVDQQLLFSGEAELGWIRELDDWVASFNSLPLAEQQQLQPREWRQLQALAGQIDGQQVYFAQVLELARGESEKVQSLRDRLRRLDQLAQALGVSARLRLTAYSDGTDTLARNREVRTLRAAELDRLLNPDGQLRLPVLSRAHPDYSEETRFQPQMRRVDLALELSPPERWQ